MNLRSLEQSQLITRYPQLEVCKEDILKAINKIASTYNNNGTLYTLGNGGSAADAEHICGELMKGFLLKRPVKGEGKEKLDQIDPNLAQNLQEGLKAVSLINSSSTITAFMNDVHPDFIFAQQVWSLVDTKDVILGISTSGNSKNVVKAFQIAKAKNIPSIALTGESGGELNNIADICIKVPEKVTHLVQELHLPVYHSICIELEALFFDE